MNLPDAAEWDFESVPDADLSACLIHEIYREFDGPPFRHFSAEKFAEYGNTKIRRLFGSKSVDLPWAMLDGDDRVALTIYYDFAKRVPRLDHLPGAVFEVPENFGPLQGEMCVGVCWDFTDAEIVAAFKSWLRENRPPGTRASDRGRSSTDLRAKLDRLAVMRLLHAASLADLTGPECKKRFPRAAALMKRRTVTAYRDRKQILKEISKDLPLFDMVDWNAKSAKTAGGRSR